MNTTAPTLPTVPLGPYQVSRLIIGDNPIYGYSHFNQLLAQHQQEAHAPDSVMADTETCRSCRNQRLAEHNHGAFALRSAALQRRRRHNPMVMPQYIAVVR